MCVSVFAGRHVNFGGNSGLYTAMQANPTIPLMDPDNPNQYNVDNYGLTGTNTSPVADIMYRDGRTNDQWITGTGTIKYHVIKGLDLIGTANIDLRESRTWLWWGTVAPVNAGYRQKRQGFTLFRSGQI